MTRQTLAHRLRFTLLPALLALAIGPAATADPGTPSYRVQSAFTHLGELVAAPVIVVLEGETARVYRGSGDEPHYTVAVRVTPATDDAVNVSLSYDSGVLSAQPNRLVPLGEAYRFTEGNVAIELRVDRVEMPDQPPAEASAATAEA